MDNSVLDYTYLDLVKFMHVVSLGATADLEWD